MFYCYNVRIINYYNLADITIFTQANPFDHAPNFTNLVRSCIINDEQVYNAWQRWIKLDVEYIKCNLLELLAQRQLLDRVHSLPGTAYIWTSNLFSMDWMMFFYGKEWSKLINRTWLNQVRDLGQSIILENLGTVVRSRDMDND